MIQNIVNSLGGGSGVDTLELVSQLVEIQSAPETQRLDSKEELLNTQLSDYGILRSAFGELETALDVLSDADTFDAKAVDFPETNLLVPTKIDPETLAGNYQISVGEIAQSQSLTSTTFSSASDQVGEGTLTIRFGQWSDGALDEEATTNFAVDADKTGGTITIDASNNSLTGLRDAINDADIGVQAAIVNDGSDFRLLITAPSGGSNEIEIVAEEAGGTPSNNDGADLSRFAFNESGSQLVQAQSGRDAELTVNGLAVTRESNQIDDVIQGLNFTIQNSSLTEVVSLSITEDRAIAEQNIRGFIDAYNNFLDTVGKLTGYDPEIEDYGSLRTDPLAKNIISRLKNVIGSEIPGISEGYTALTNIGVRTERDGSITLNENDFTTAFSENYDLVKSLFSPNISSDSALVQVTGYNVKSVPGTYAVNIGSEATKAELLLTTLAGPPASFDSTGKDYSFEISVDGVASGVITLAENTFTPEEMADELQSKINNDAALSEAGASVTVDWDTDHFVITSDEFGSNSTISISVLNNPTDAAELGLLVDSASGSDVTGTVGGDTGFGLANVLLPKLGSDSEGLSMIISPGATTANITFSRGFGLEMSRIIDDFLKSSGLIKQREATIRERLTDVDDDRQTLEFRTEAYRARLQAQFIAMDQIVQSLQNAGSFFDGIGDRLPFTAGN